jgi:predicted lactoylglutathione lyase
VSIPARIGIVTLGVAEVARSLAFYEAIGWERCESSMDEICWFRTADSYLGLFSNGDLAGDIGIPPDAVAGFRGVTLAINVDRAEEVQVALDEAAAAGGSILKPATDVIFGISGYFADPDGHAWEVAYNPSFAIDADGRITIP